MSLENKRILIACPGIGHIQRGFETFATELHQALTSCPGLKVWLAKGAGNSEHSQIKIRCLKRNSVLAKLIALILRRDSYFVEQLTFSIGLLPFIFNKKPELIVFSDGTIGNVLSRIRKLLRLKFALLFSNGGPLLPPYCKCDHIHQVLPLDPMLPSDQSTYIPYGFNIPATFESNSSAEKTTIRKRLALPQERFILLSVASLSFSHKRLDYLITEIAGLPEPRPFLLLLGNVTNETKKLRELALQLLGRNGFKMQTVDASEIHDFYRASDALCHSALKEGFGRVFIEALANGLPVLAHSSEEIKYILGKYGIYSNFSDEGSLRKAIFNLDKTSINEVSAQKSRHQYAYSNFSWDVLKEQYKNMLLKVIKNDVSATNSAINNRYET